ncbi:hypothetical protein B0H14DRAFT_2597601 [Mycena olivaceomarginata]|nr:hypothetical protein B0H14DRAFT_2597601 [Mycena olivaceomarginata]
MRLQTINELPHRCSTPRTEGKTQDSYSQKRRMDIPGYRLMKCWAIYKAATILHPPSPNINPAYANQGWKRNPAEAGTDDFSNQGWKRIFPEGTDAHTTLGRKRSAVRTLLRWGPTSTRIRGGKGWEQSPS